MEEILVFGIFLLPWMILGIFFLFLPFLIFWIWAMVDCLNSKLSSAEKLFWFLVIFFFNILGALLYLIFAKMATTPRKVKRHKGKKQLLRSRHNRVIAGVCGGLGEYLGIDPTVIRLVWILFILSGGTGIPVYIIAWIIIPGEK